MYVQLSVVHFNLQLNEEMDSQVGLVLYKWGRADIVNMWEVWEVCGYKGCEYMRCVSKIIVIVAYTLKQTPEF